jgi:hypothetical protein
MTLLLLLRGNYSFQLTLATTPAEINDDVQYIGSGGTLARDRQGLPPASPHQALHYLHSSAESNAIELR